MRIGAVADPHNWPFWEQAKAYLEPARARGECAVVWEPDEALFAVMDGDELLAVATAWLDTGNKRVEVKHVGGRDHRRWLAALNEVIGAAASSAGATSMVAFGRPGWRRALKAVGWTVTGEAGGSTIYSRGV